MNKGKAVKNKRGFTKEQCRKGGQAIRGYDTAEDVRRRAMLDAKGLVLREGVTYTVQGELHWQKRRALEGRTNQVELVCDGEIIKTTGNTLLRNKLHWLRD
jgi:hypothetical protein